VKKNLQLFSKEIEWVFTRFRVAQCQQGEKRAGRFLKNFNGHLCCGLPEEYSFPQQSK